MAISINRIVLCRVFFRNYHVSKGDLIGQNMAPFREFKGQTTGHFLTSKKANRQKIMLAYKFIANLKSVSCIRVQN